jgi:CheY-like chemotaxis protein
MTRVVSPDRCTGIKTDPALRSITIIAATSYALNGKDQIARAANCDDVLAETYTG